MTAKELLQYVVDFANNRTEPYQVEIRFWVDSNRPSYVNICSCKEEEFIFPYTYIDLYNTHLSREYIHKNLKELLPQQRWYKCYMDGVFAILNYKL